MARIPQAFIDELLARADIVEVIGARVALKKAGANYKGLCPFHGEKTPSFTVSPSKSFYHCFGCGAHGSAIGFIMQYDNLSYPEAIEALAESLGIEVPRERPETPEAPRDDNAELYILLREADQIYRGALREHPAAIAYLKKRGIDGRTAGRFAIGYAPSAWDTLLRALGTSDARITKLVQAGLVIAGDGGKRYDRFRDRIMFPIRNARGQVIGFGGRVLDTGEPKYLNSPETPVFRKGHELYGLYEARKNPGRPKQIIVVEGYLDVTSLVQFGVENVVATLGTATTPENVRRLTRMADRVIFCFDGDRAGRTAAWRAMETALPYGGGTVELKFLLLPEGDDPDTFVRGQGADAFRDLADAAAPLSDFLVAGLAERLDFANVDGRARFQAIAKPLLKRLPEGTYRGAIMESFGTRLRLPSAVLSELMSDAAPARPAPSGRETSPRKTPIRRLVSLALRYPAAAAKVERLERLEELNQNGADVLGRVLAAARELPDARTDRLLEHLRTDAAFEYLHRIAAEEDPAFQFLDRLTAAGEIADQSDAAAKELNETLDRLVKDARQARAAEAAVAPEAIRRVYGPGPTSSE
jgi:DNA primase